MKAACPLLLLVACAAPEPLPLRGVEIVEERFAPPRRDAADLARLLREKRELTLDDVLAIVDVLNPQLEAERANVDLATAALWDAQLYPNPSLLLGVEDAHTSGPFSDSKRTIGVSVPVVVGGRIGAASSAAARQREVAAMNYVGKRREILGAAKLAFVTLLAAKRRAELARETRDIARGLHDATEARYKVQAVPEMELLKAAVNLAKSQSDLSFAEKDLAVARTALLAAMGDADLPVDKFVGALSTKFVVPAFDALRGQITTHPRVESARKAKEAAQLDLDAAKAERIPDLAVEARVGDDAESGAVVEFGIEVPLPIFNRNQAKIAAVEIRIRQAELAVQAVRVELARRLDEVYRTFAASQERVTVYESEIVPKAQTALDLTNEGYRQGKFGYLDVLDAQRTLAEASLAFVAAVADLNASAIELETLTGTRLK